MSEEDFDEKVIQSRENWFVFLGTPYNGGSKKLRPDWDFLAARFLGTKINIGEVNCIGTSTVDRQRIRSCAPNRM